VDEDEVADEQPEMMRANARMNTRGMITFFIFASFLFSSFWSVVNQNLRNPRLIEWIR
jgi:hypothetical protein